MMRLVRTPMSRAASTFIESARIALPVQVRLHEELERDHHADGRDEDHLPGVLDREEPRIAAVLRA